MFNCQEITKLFYVAHGNFGDELSLYLVEKITGKNFSRATRYEDDKLVAIGSILSRDILYTRSYVWGSGTLTRQAFEKKPFQLFPLNRMLKRTINEIRRLPPPCDLLAENPFFVQKKAVICAVRGPRTRDLLLKEGVKCPAIYGDPAIVLPKFYAPKAKSKYPIGLILHHSQENLFDKYALEELGIHLISILREGAEQLEEFIDEVASCERVFTSSLHGLIVAQAYGVPAQWLQMAGQPIHEDECHKFYDYLQGANQIEQTPIVMENSLDEIAKLKDMTPPRVMPFIGVDALLDAFPIR